MRKPIQSFVLVLAATWLSVYSAPARAQAWVDVNALDGKLPAWVDPKYYHAEPRQIVPATPRCVWVEPVYRTACHEVWHEPGLRTVCERIWIDARTETREIYYYDACGCRCVRYEQICTPGHYEERQRQVVVGQGYWETVTVRELVSPGHWASADYR